MSKLQVRVEIDPVPKVIDPVTFNELSEGELVEFDLWQQKRMADNGLEPTPLIGQERGMLKAFLYFIATRTP